MVEHERLTLPGSGSSLPALFGVTRGRGPEDLRRKACRDRAAALRWLGIGGALEKENSRHRLLRWCNEELPEFNPRHLLGISKPDDIFTAIENGADTFDCVSPTRVARNSAFYSSVRFGSPGTLQIGFRTFAGWLRLLHLRQLFAGVHPPPVQGP